MGPVRLCHAGEMAEDPGPSQVPEHPRAPRSGAAVPPAVPVPGADPVAAAILRAAGELLAQRSPSQVSLREIAAHAGVNYGLIHRHFGTKDELIVQLFQSFSDYGATLMGAADDVYAALRQAFTADAGSFAEILAWAILDRADPARLWGDRELMVDIAEQVHAAWASGTPAPVERTAFDPHVVATLVVLVVAVWEFYAPYLAVMGAYPDRPASDVKAEVLDLLQLLVAAASPRSPGGPAGPPGTATT